jgi:hypothetical protein
MAPAERVEVTNGTCITEASNQSKDIARSKATLEKGSAMQSSHHVLHE